MKVRLFNTLGRKKEIFKPIRKGKVGLYTCGPTVYWYAHLGNMRTYLFEDFLKRTLLYNGFSVKHVMNITDVGHLTSQADTGEDKMELAAKKEGKSAWQIAQFYTKVFKEDLKALNIKKPDIWIKATDTIRDQIELIKTLEKKGFTYKIKDGIYFDSQKLKDYGKLWPPSLKGRKKSLAKNLEKFARIEKVPGKKRITDFALWKFAPKGVKRQMEWDSPWGRGFPGWHTECVVMSVKYLGIPFDIHCGGIDHILIHHTNEIAQAEAAYGKLLANYWLHGEFLTVKEGKISKSAGNIVTVGELIKKGINPLAFRYLTLGAKYRAKLTFSWEALENAEKSLERLYRKMGELKGSKEESTLLGRLAKEYKKEFLKSIDDDLNMPKALSLLWRVLREKELSKGEKYYLALDFDKVFGLGLDSTKKEKIPQEIKRLVKEREKYRKERKWQEADEIRKKIKNLGYQIEDTKEGTKIEKL